jgi:hypothetical protein
MLPEENKTGTHIAQATPAVTAAGAPQRRPGLCGYVVAPGAAPFCDRPALPDGSYCEWHHALCAVAPASPDFAALAAAQTMAADRPGAPPELGWLNAPPPEFPDDSDDDCLAGLDLPPAQIAHNE